MGNSESSSSQFPYDGKNNESDQSKNKKHDEETTGISSALKVGAAIAGTALLAFGAWNLSSPSDSTENQSQKVGVNDRSGLSGGTNFRRNPRLKLEGHTGISIIFISF